MRLVAFVLGAALSGRANADTPARASLAAAVGLGGGTQRFGPVDAAAELAGTYWIGRWLGATATFRGYFSGEPGGRGAQGSSVTAAVVVRHSWTASRFTARFPAHVDLSLGAGLGHHDGHDRSRDDVEYVASRFDVYAPAWTVSAGIIGEPSHLMFGLELAVYGFDRGFAVVPMFVGGVAL